MKSGALLYLAGHVRNRRENDRARRLHRALIKFGQHQPWCAYTNARPCDCGLIEAVNDRPERNR